MEEITFDQNAEPPVRQGWEAAFRRMHEAGDDALIIPDVFDDEIDMVR
ncbi:MAG: hypothetical protein IT270_03585 [Saprospiraceae bacterium]|nr:hypothetical protein [Saprospiraceae bacterium]